MINRLVPIVAAIGVSALITACGQTEPAAPAGASDDPITVVTSTDVWASVAAAVGGSEVNVKPIVADPSGDPHSYQATAKDAAELRGAQLVVYNGGGYDDFVEQSLGQDGPRRIKAVDLRADGEPHGFARGAHEAAHETENEHVWYDLPTVAMVAGEIAAQLSEIRPSAKAAFVANADAFDTKLDDLEVRVSELATAHGGATVAATEPISHYLLDAAKLTDATPAEFTEAIEEETDPPADVVAEIQALVSERGVKLLVHNPQTETPVVTDLVAKARAAGLPVVEMTETLPSGQDYLTWMGNQIKALSTALAGP
jgi:zinc/manganese transport system substrate-binding protein